MSNFTQRRERKRREREERGRGEREMVKEKNSEFGRLMEEKDKPGFFIILQEEKLTSEKMRMIPQEFIRIWQEKGVLPFKMVLKMRWGGKSWPIQISKTSKFYYMEKSGWDEFVNDNGLLENELVTFTQKEKMFFTVDIYQINGEELLKPRKSPAIASSSSSSKNKTEQVINMDIDVKIEESESTTAQSTRRTKNPKQEINKKSEEIEKSNKKKKKKIDNVSSSLIEEFTVTITKSYLLFLAIPKRFLEHMPEDTKKFMIHHPNGKKSWKVIYLVTDAQSRFSAGWARLAREYPLVVGDVCTFKLIKPNEMLLEVSRRAKEETP